MSKGIKKVLRIMSAAVIGSVITITLSSTAYASIDSLIIKEKNTGEIYEYNYTELGNSLKDNMFEASKGALYKDFINLQSKNDISAFHDDKRNSYISYDSVAKALKDAMLSGENFDVDKFMEQSEKAEEVNFTSIIKKEESNGQVVETKKTNKFEVIDIN